VGSGGRDAGRQVPPGGRADGLSQGGRAGVSPRPAQPLAQAVEHQAAGAVQQGDLDAVFSEGVAPHPRRRHLPQ
jgi:hypothetical protein